MSFECVHYSVRSCCTPSNIDDTICILDAGPGGQTSISISNLPGRRSDLSSESGRLVVAMTISLYSAACPPKNTDFLAWKSYTRKESNLNECSRERLFFSFSLDEYTADLAKLPENLADQKASRELLKSCSEMPHLRSPLLLLPEHRSRQRKECSHSCINQTSYPSATPRSLQSSLYTQTDRVER